MAAQNSIRFTDGQRPPDQPNAADRSRAEPANSANAASADDDGRDDGRMPLGSSVAAPNAANTANRRPDPSSRRLDMFSRSEHVHPDHGPDDTPSDDTPSEHAPPANRTNSSDTDQTGDPGTDDDDASSVKSDESFTMRDRQNAINTAHPFGIRSWKPALYKKRRSVEQNADEDIHSEPNRSVPAIVQLGNLSWTSTFGLVSFSTFAAVWVPVFLSSPFSGYARRYSASIREMASFFWWPFGKSVQSSYSDAYREEDDGHGRSVADYLAWQQNTDGPEQPNRSFFAPRRRRPSQYSQNERPRNASESRKQSRSFGRGRWSAARVSYYIGYYVSLVPVSVAVATSCWLGVFGVPMARVIYHMLYHMRIHPLALRVRTASSIPSSIPSHLGANGADDSSEDEYSIVSCTYRAFGSKYYKYTVGGTNVMSSNSSFVVFVTIIDSAFVNSSPSSAHFLSSLVSIVPLAHFIGQAVASISAQSSMSMGATINAFFSTIVEVYSYIVALSQGKGELVEGSITGSVLAGVSSMPGVSMCAGALKQKTQRFNPKSAGATSTMSSYTVVGVIAPTIFFAVYGPSEIKCDAHYETGERRCWSSAVPLMADDPSYVRIIKPFGGFCAVASFITYAIGLMFTSRTHAAMIWNANAEEIEEGNTEDGPNWGRSKSYLISLSATVSYAMIAEILVDSVDVVLDRVNISQRMLGLTVFALVPNTTEFLNAISFASYGNVSSSLEIGSAYALQVCLSQIPALVLASQRHVSAHIGEASRKYVFVSSFPKWDTWAWIISMILYCHVHSEGRSNYFKGSILILAYSVLIAGFYFNDVIADLMPSTPELFNFKQAA